MTIKQRLARVVIAPMVIMSVVIQTGCSMKQSGLYQVTVAEDNQIVSEPQETMPVAQESEAEPETIYVHICGAVNNPGVFEFERGKRVFDAVEAAGGFATDAACDYVNLAKLLDDGDKIVIPTMQELEENPSYLEDSRGESLTDGKININTADINALCSITGIGETRAKAIIDYRDSNGPFGGPEDIKKVSGIGEATYAKLKDEITTGK